MIVFVPTLQARLLHRAFPKAEDTWHWNDSAERAFDEVVTGPHSDAPIMLRAMRSALGENDMMAVRLIELHPTASHYLKTLLDSIFDPRNFGNIGGCDQRSGGT